MEGKRLGRLGIRRAWGTVVPRRSARPTSRSPLGVVVPGAETRGRRAEVWTADLGSGGRGPAGGATGATGAPGRRRGGDGQGGGDCADRPEAGQNGDQEERGEGRGLPPTPRRPPEPALGRMTPSPVQTPFPRSGAGLLLVLGLLLRTEPSIPLPSGVLGRPWFSHYLSRLPNPPEPGFLSNKKISPA